MINERLKEKANGIMWLCIFAMILMIVSACSTASNKTMVPLMQLEPEDFLSNQITDSSRLGKSVIIQTSNNDNRPDWIHKPTFEQNNFLYFTGGFLNGTDFSVSIRCANAEAMKNLVQAIGQYVRAQFSMCVKVSNDGVDRYVEDGIALFANNLFIQGIKQAETYFEERHNSSNPESSFYNAWVRLEISKADYLKAKIDVLRQLKNDFETAGEIEAKEKAQELLYELKNDIHAAI